MEAHCIAPLITGICKLLHHDKVVFVEDGY